MFCDLVVEWGPGQGWPLTVPHTFQEKICWTELCLKISGSTTTQRTPSWPHHNQRSNGVDSDCTRCWHSTQGISASPDTDSWLDVTPKPNCAGHVSLATSSQVSQALLETVHPLASSLCPETLVLRLHKPLKRKGREVYRLPSWVWIQVLKTALTPLAVTAQTPEFSCHHEWSCLFFFFF